MLTNIRCSGFKSLNEFDFSFRRGLNILVGPNGSGKTNIIQFLEFLGHLTGGSLLEAVSRSGGAGNIFRRTRTGNLSRTIDFSFTGKGEYRDFQSKNTNAVEYFFEAGIALSPAENSLLFEKQRLQIWVWPTSNLFERADSPTPDFSIEFEALPGKKSGVSLDKLSEHAIGDYRRVQASRRTTDARKRDDDSFIETLRAEIIESTTETGRTVCLFEVLDRFVRPLRLITRDLSNAASYNISPNRVRIPEDIASEPTIKPDGSGLAATLYALWNVQSMGRYQPFFAPSIFDDPDEAEKIRQQIIDYGKLVNEAIERVYVLPDPIESKIRIFLSIAYDDGTLELPFSFASDGTAKWFALVTAILTNRSLFAIEEPENYLHPLMQREIVRIVRDTFEGRDSFAIMSTHSETILNSANPDELVIVSMDAGVTRASRPASGQALIEQINKTGFGLGYYYLAGAIE